MDPNPKISRLRDMDEKTVREAVLVPLLMRMGLKAPTIYHGPRERGKDIVCFDIDRLGRREYLAVVAKVTDLDGSVSSNNSLVQVVHQIEQCFDVPYEDLFGMNRVTMNRVWVITTGRIVSGAADSVYDQLYKRNLSKLVSFISGESLVQLIEEHYPAYWDEALEPVDVVKEQKHRLAQFSKRLLLTLGANGKDVESTISAVINSSFPPEVNVDSIRMLSRLSSYSVEFDSISAEYAHPFFTEGNSVREAFFALKEHIYYAMFEIDDAIRSYEEVIKKNDPKELLAGFSDTLRHEYPFSHRSPFSAAYDAWRWVEYLELAVDDIDKLYANLRQLGKLEWAISVVNSVSRLREEIESFLAHLDKESFTLFWRIETSENEGALRFLYEDAGIYPSTTFSTSHRKEIEISSKGEPRTRPITSKDVIWQVQSKIRNYLDQLLIEAGIKEKDDL